ncbi:MAG: hypothetical protein IJU81_06275, partial [Bacteroidales bacterium]|nr:hypothetical protein [Bacteroidales bacterium]
ESVVFAPGNLQYIGSAATPYWKFADRQYDYFGTTTSQNSTATNVDRDLFGWGTSGWNNGNMRYMPYNTDYPGNSSNGYGYGPTYGSSYTYNLTDYPGHPFSNADWGVFNAIRNGGNAAGQWHTPSHDAQGYIFNTRTSSTVNGTANARYVKAEVGGKNGLIVFPDSYTHPAGVTLPASINTYNVSFTTNRYTVADWLQMEAAGAVFLPASGYRSGTSVSNVGSYGSYWSSTYSSSYDAWSVYFNVGNFRTNGSNYRYYGRAVRLVRG